MTKKIEMLKQIKELIISDPKYFAIVNKDESYDGIRPEVNELLYQLKHEATIRANNELTILEKAIRNASEFLNNAKTVSSEYGGNGVNKLTTLYEKAEHELKNAKKKVESENYIAILEAEKIASSTLAIANSVISESKSVIKKANIEEERNREIESRRVKDALAGCLRIAIVLGIIFVIGWYNLGPPNKIYSFQSQKAFEQYWDCSGSCRVVDSHVELHGSMTLKDIPDFGSIEVVPVITMPNSLTISVGPYYFEYYQAYGTGFYPSSEIYHKVNIYYQSKAIGLNYDDTPKLKFDDKPQTLKIQKSWWSWVIDQVPGGDPSVFINGNHLMAGSGVSPVNPEPVQGKISVSGQNANIQEVKIYYGSIIARIFG